MKPLKQNQTNNHQKEGNRIEDKKKTNIKFNSAIFFQIGLIVALVVSAWAMNLNIGENTKVEYNEERLTLDEPTFYDFDIFVPKVEPVKTIAKVTPPAQHLVTNKFEVVKNDVKIIETKLVDVIKVPDIPVTPIVKPTVPVVKPPVGTTLKNVNSVEFLPIFPGCETAGDKEATIACMSEKISKFVGRKFNTSVADQDTTGSQKIYVQFKIDKNGNVVDIMARAPNRNLEKEAKRVISRLPEFTPGKMGDVPVDVLYNLPIIFQVE